MIGVSIGRKGLAACACGLASIATLPAVVSRADVVARPPVSQKPPGSLCAAGETAIFSCPLGAKRVSVCGKGGQATYRYGVPGKIELTARGLTLAAQTFSGGGETQIQAINGDYGYVLFDRTTRTGFGTGGRDDPDSRSGLLVRHAGRIVSAKRCDDDAPIPARARDIIPAGGTVVAH